ncbi:hypothetical protein BGZ94_009593 [Podila epigama]|nr:hypothetical protein BGZ94_009593 [Podila epigama]
MTDNNNFSTTTASAPPQKQPSKHDTIQPPSSNVASASPTISSALESHHTPHLAVETNVPDAENTAQWFYKPYLQPSSISTTATSSLVPDYRTLITPQPSNAATTTASTANSLSNMSSNSSTISSLISVPSKPAATLLSTLQSSLASANVVGIHPRNDDRLGSPSSHHSRATEPYSAPLPRPVGSFHINPQPPPPLKDEPIHNNPYKPPSHTNSRPFVPPKVPGYDFSGGSQAGNMGLLLGKRLSDGLPVTGKLHQSRVLLQHEYRILKRLKYPNTRYVPQPASSAFVTPEASSGSSPSVASTSSTTTTNDSQSQPSVKATTTSSSTEGRDNPKRCHSKPGMNKVVYETGAVETQRYFNRIVEGFMDLDRDEMSMLILERLGPNILSNHHHRFVGLEDVDGHNSPETQEKKNVGSPFPDVYTFLVFCLKMASVLESLLSSNLAHLNISPLFIHWAFPEDDPPETESNDGTSNRSRNRSENQNEDNSQEVNGDGETVAKKKPYFRSYKCFTPEGEYQPMQEIDVNDTKIRLFDFTHSKILSHERARAPNNIAEWQVPGFLEYHLQFLAPEQTGRAETWMDHRTDIYGLGVTLFSLLTMQFPYTGTDSVQILQGVLTKDLPPLSQFRPDMPPVIDAILRKMTQKQPSQRYQNAFGFKQDILKCLNTLHRTGTVESFELGQHDISYQFVLPNNIFGRHIEQQMITAAIVQAAGAYKHSISSDMDDRDETELVARKVAAVNDSDHYVFEDDIVSLQSQSTAKIPLSSKTLLRTPKPFDGGKSVHRGSEATDPVVRVIFVSGPTGVGKTVMVRGIATAARNSGLFAAGIFEADNATPYSAILSCVQSVLQQLLAQHTDALASLVVAIRTAFEPNSGIGIICDLVPELRYFFNGSEMPESKDVPLSHSVVRFHALILKLIRVISTQFFMTWLIDDLQFADENSIDLLATLVNVNKRLPIVLIITHRDTLDCLVKVKQILGGSSVSNTYSANAAHRQGSMANPLSGANRATSAGGGGGGGGGGGVSSLATYSKTTAMRATGLPMVVRGGGGVRFIRLQNPTLETIQDFLSMLLHREKDETESLAKVLYQKSWLTIRQLVLELYRNETIFFNCLARIWEWEPDSEKLAHVVRTLTGEEYAFLEDRFRALDCDTKKTLICASICGPSFSIHDLQQLVSAVDTWKPKKCRKANSESPKGTTEGTAANLSASDSADATTKVTVPKGEYDNKGCNAMAGLQTAIREGILVYTSEPDHLRFHHGVMRKVAANMLAGSEYTEELHFQMAQILFRTPGQEFRIASHVLQSLDLIKKKIAQQQQEETEEEKEAERQQGQRPGQGQGQTDHQTETLDQSPEMDIDTQDSQQDDLSDSEDINKPVVRLDTRALRMVLALAGEKSQKSGAQDMALAYWKAALSLLPDNCWDGQVETAVDEEKEDSAQVSMMTAYGDVEMSENDDCQDQHPSPLSYQTATLYHEALKLHLQCIEAERWREHFDEAMEVCNIVLAKVKNPIDRARVYQHQIEMSVWAYNRSEQAKAITLQCMKELGLPDGINFNPTPEEMRVLFHETHQMLLAHMEELRTVPHRMCQDPKISMMMEVLSVANASLYYSNVPFMAAGIAYSMKVLCEHGICKDSGRALVSFAMTHSTWYDCLEKAYELGELACEISNGSNHVKFLFYMTVQQWGDPIAKCIPALDEAITAVDLTSDRLFHIAGIIHVSALRLLLGRIHLNDCLSTTVDLLSKHLELVPKSHGVEVMHGIIQMIKCLKGQTDDSDPEAIFDDVDNSEPKANGQRSKATTTIHNNSTYQLLKIVSCLIYGHYEYIDQVADPWHDDSKSIMHFESSFLAHFIFMSVGLALVNLLRSTGQAPEVRRKRRERLWRIRDRMEVHAKQYATNHAPMFYLLEAEMADQVQEQQHQGMKRTLLLYEKAIAFSTEGDFPLFKCLAYELAGKCHLRHGLVTSARCLMANASRGYQKWGAKGKVNWFLRTYPELFPTLAEHEPPIGLTRGLFHRPSETNVYTGMSNMSGTVNNTSGSCTSTSSGETLTSPWLATASPKTVYSPSTYGSDTVSAAAAAMAESCLTSSFTSSTAAANGHGYASNATSSATAHSTLSSGPLHSLQHSRLGSPQSPELDNVDLDVLDFSSVIEAMQVVASEIDLDLLLIKSLGVLNQSVGAKRCCIIISKDQELVLAASQGDLGRCEAVNPPMEVEKCQTLFHGVINYVIHTSAPCLLTNAMDDPRFCADEYLKQRPGLKTVLCAPILHKAALVGVLYMEEFPERAFANKRMLVMNLLVQQLGISITNALLYQSVLQSETKLNGLLENMPCGIALWDAAADNCQYVNSGWSDMTGFTVEEIMTSSWQAVMQPAMQAEDLVNEGIAWRERVTAGKPCQWESRYGCKDGTSRWGLVRMLPIKAPATNPTSTSTSSSSSSNVAGGNGSIATSSPTCSNPDRILQWLTVTIDIDDQRRAVQLKSNFLANMSHELRTPFSGILGMLSLLRDSSGLSHEQFEFVDMAKASCEMLIRIVDDLLNFSKLEADKVTLECIPMCFEEIVGDVCDLLVPLASRKGLELIVLLDPTLPLLLIGDPDRLKQILMNLIGNAIKFSTRGNVVVKYWHERIPKYNQARKQETRRILDRLDNNCKIDTSKYREKHGLNDLDFEIGGDGGNEASARLGDDIILHCSVTDQGIGLSPEEQKMLFVSFQQTDNGTTRKYGGTGLGLSICAQLIAHMQGKITVDSEKGKGSTFTFSAHLRTVTEQDKEQNPVESTRILECQRALHMRWEALKSRRVLILSPNRLLREQITRTVPGAEYVGFDDVASALESGVLGIVPEKTASGDDLDVDLGNKDEEGGKASPPSNSLQQFDYILVDHVLDSAVLDSIYPSPTIAFILLLAPTTETLRWILPPAQKQGLDEEDEPECAQVDVGGRGRILQPADLDFTQRAMGRVNSVSYISALKGGPIGQDTASEVSTPASASASTSDAGTGVQAVLEGVHDPQLMCTQANGQRRKSDASELFKKRKPSGRGPVTLKRHVLKGMAMKDEAWTSFQVCRMIKPVRRLKLLQIMYNALMHQQQGSETAHIEELLDEEIACGQPRQQQLSLQRSRSTSPVTGVSTYSVSSSLKRPRDELDSGNKATSKVFGSSAKARLYSKAKNITSAVAREAPDNADTNDPPKRARNNDALTLLLTEEERKRCHGINVLVAEDDFVSQKILEKQLSKLGMNVIIASNGQEAVKQWLAVDRGFYTIAIFDHHMPIMDGLAATKKIRALEAEFAEEKKRKAEAEGRTYEPSSDPDANIRIPIVGLSADIQHRTKESCIRAGMDEYMTKPLLTKGLALLIQRYCCR